MLNLQMYYTINFTKKLLSNIHGLQRDNVLCNLKIVCDNVYDPKHFACDQYDKKFTKEDPLDRHKQAFHGPRHSCQECDKTFIHQASLELHVKSDQRRNRLFTHDGHMLLSSL